MGKPVHCCPKHQFPLDWKGEQCPICREEIEDEFGEPDDDIEVTCTACGGDGTALDNGTNFGECDECDGTGVMH